MPEVTRRLVRLGARPFVAVARLDESDRERLLDALVRVADSDFGGHVERRMVTPVYTGRRAG